MHQIILDDPQNRGRNAVVIKRRRQSMVLPTAKGWIAAVIFHAADGHLAATIGGDSFIIAVK